jgi:DNA-binding PadR family transcriptional regulator
MAESELLQGMGISQITNGACDAKAGSLFPALHRMEQAGWQASERGNRSPGAARNSIV